MSNASALSTNTSAAQSTRLTACKQTLRLLAALLFVCGCLGSTVSAQTISSFTVTDSTVTPNYSCTYPNSNNALCSIGPGNTLTITGSGFDVSGNVSTCDCPGASIISWNPGNSGVITATVNFVGPNSPIPTIQVETVRGAYSNTFSYVSRAPVISSIQVGGCTSSLTQTCHIAVGQTVTINGNYFGTTTAGTSGLQVAMCDCANATINSWTNTQITVTATQVAPNSGVAVGLVGLTGWSNSVPYWPVSGLSQTRSLDILVPPGAVNQSEYTSNVGNMIGDSSVTGATITIYWSDFDCGSVGCGGKQYNYDITDAAFAPWEGKGKKINIVLQMISNAPQTQCPSSGVGSRGGSSPSNGNCAMPPWVWSTLAGSDQTNVCNGQQTPNFFNATLQQDYKNAIVALIDHYANAPEFTGNYIRVALGHGGEILPSPQWKDQTPGGCFSVLGPWATAVWTSSVTTTEQFVPVWVQKWLIPMVTFMGQKNFNGSTTPMQIMGAITPMGTVPNSGCPGCEVPDAIAPYYVTNNVGFGSQGLEISDVNSATSTGDWVHLFNTYQGQVPLELQTLGQSCPGGVGQCGGTNTGTANCTGPNWTYSNVSLASCTGKLGDLLPFASQKYATIFEVYYQDWDLANISSYCTRPGGTGTNQYCSNINNIGADTEDALDNF